MFKKLRHWTHLARFLVNHHCRAHAAVRMATARDLAPFGLRSVNQIREIRKGAHQRQRKPIARRLCDTNLILNIVRQVRKRVTLLQPALRRDLFVAASKRNRLKRKERNLLRIVESKSNNRSYLIVVDAVDQCGYQHNLNARFMQVVDCPHLHIEQIADLTMAVGIVAHAVKLQVNVTQTQPRQLHDRNPCSWRIRFRSSLPARCCNQPCAHT